MGIRLTVKMRAEQGGADKPQVVMLDDEVVTLGRDPGCQVVLAQTAVSRNHARISCDGPLYFVEDLGSSFGTLVNGAKLPKGEKRLLRNGDLIAIAQFDVTFDRVASVASLGGTQDEEVGNKTAFVSRKVVKDVMKGLAAGGEQPYFRLMNGPNEGQRIEIADAQEFVIGRDETVADVVLKDDLVSRRHCKVRRDWSGTHLEDLGSRNGFKINKKKNTKATLKDRDEVEIGGVRLLYIDPSEVRETPLVLGEDDDAGDHTNSLRPDPEGSPPRAKPVRKDPEPEPEPALEPEPVAAPPEEEPAPEPASDEPPPEEPPADEPPYEDEEAPEATGLKRVPRLLEQADHRRGGHRRRDGAAGAGAPGAAARRGLKPPAPRAATRC